MGWAGKKWEAKNIFTSQRKHNKNKFGDRSVMKQKSLKALLIVVAWLICCPGGAFAADYTIHVPVDLRDIHPDVTRIQLIIGVKGETDGQPSGHGGSEIKEFYRPANGWSNMNQVITFTFNLREGVNPAGVRYYYGH